MDIGICANQLAIMVIAVPVPGGMRGGRLEMI
jgi:hypothetical protein